MNRKEKIMQYRQLLERRREALPQAEAHTPVSDSTMAAMARRAAEGAVPSTLSGVRIPLDTKRHKTLMPISSAVAAAVLVLVAVRMFTPAQIETERVIMGSHAVQFTCNNNCDPSATLASLDLFLI